jgi:hypothetical protein
MSSPHGSEIVPERVYSRAYEPVESLRTFGAAMREKAVSVKTRMLFGKLASYPPHVRLGINLRNLISCMTRSDIGNILADGLTADEKVALAELDRKGLSVRSKECAHGLLNVHERWMAMKYSLRRMFREAVHSRNEFIDPDGEINGTN